MDEKKPMINIEINPEISEGVYSNCVFIAHSPSEFILDFARLIPGPQKEVQKAKIVSRVIMTPQNALILKHALDENIKKYEGRFEKIKIFGKTEKEIGFK